MATPLDLDRRGALFKLDALELHVQEFRQIYASPGLHSWSADVLPGMVSSWGIQLSPLEQFVALSEIFCGGDRLAYGTHFKPLTHIVDGVWELKTEDLRVFGFFHRKDCFIGVVADDATRIKKYNLYRGHADVTTNRFIAAVDLDNPKCVPGDDPHAVVSNFDYS
jgi:hypothetical protein